jgi:hypothetical protein
MRQVGTYRSSDILNELEFNLLEFERLVCLDVLPSLPIHV